MIFESIISGIISTLAGCLTSHVIDNTTVQIENAPSWYETHADNSLIYAYANNTGDVEVIQKTKDDTKNIMVKKVQMYIALTIDKKFEHIKDEDEKELLKEFAHDDKIESFVNSSAIYKYIYQDEGSTKGIFRSYRPARIFVCMTLDKKALIAYEEKRLREIASQLTFHKSKKGFNELDNDMRGLKK